MDNEMIERCIEEVSKLIQGYNTLGLKTPVREVVLSCITAMREPTDKIIEAAFGKSDLSPHPFRTAWYNMIDAIIGDK